MTRLDERPLCPTCQKPMNFARWVKEPASVEGSQITVPLDSKMYLCDEHGLWRVYISGAIEPYRD